MSAIDQSTAKPFNLLPMFLSLLAQLTTTSRMALARSRLPELRQVTMTSCKVADRGIGDPNTFDQIFSLIKLGRLLRLSLDNRLQELSLIALALTLENLCWSEALIAPASAIDD